MLNAQKAREIKAAGLNDWYKEVSAAVRKKALNGGTSIIVDGDVFGTLDNTGRTKLKNELESAGYAVTAAPDWTHTLTSVTLDWTTPKAADLTDLTAYATTASVTTALGDYYTKIAADAKFALK
jgi:hypothetical protein